MSGPVVSAKGFFVGQGKTSSCTYTAVSEAEEALLTRSGLQILHGTTTVVRAPRRLEDVWT